MSNNGYIGRTIGNYRVLAELGSGSFGVVYRGEHIILTNRTGAIKLMHAAHLDSQQDRDSFLREARLLEMLKHPHILPILDVGIHEGFPYLVTEFASLGSLRDRLQQIDPQLLPMEESLKILSQIGQALDHAHQQNIIHRDIKPANILFNGRGDALLADFGIATTLATASIKFVEASGSPPYMAPEQFQGTISKESDQYSLGCIAYELFTGHRPFSAPDPFTLGYKHLMEQPLPPTRYNQRIPAYIELAILKAMAKERTERYPNVAAFIAALHPFPSYQSQPLMPLQPTTGGSGFTYPTATLQPQMPPQTAVTGGPTLLSSPSWPPTQAPAAYNERAARMSGPGAYSGPTTGLPAQPIQPMQPTPPPLFQREQDMPTLPSQQDPGRNMGYRYANPMPPYPVPNPGTPMPPMQFGPGPMTPPPPVPNANQQTLPYAGQLLGPQVNFSQTTVKDMQPKRRRRWPLILAAVIVLILLLFPGSVAAFYTFAYPGVATVALTPLHKDLNNTFTITQVTGNPNTARNQVAGARLITATKSQTGPATATGVVHTSATAAYGILTMSNGDSSGGTTYYVYSGFKLSDNNGLTVIVDTYLQVAPGQTGTFRAHTVNTGASSNFGPGVFNYSYNDGNGTLKIYNTASFTGGKNAGAYSVVQQSDIDGAANPLKAPVTTNAQKAFQGMIKANEQQVGSSQCSSKVSSSVGVGGQASGFDVTVSVTCTGEAYDPSPPESMAAGLLKSQASSELDPSYVLAGNIVSTVKQVTVIDAKKGILSLLIAAAGIWDFQFNHTQEQALAKLISGKSVQDAQTVLSQQNGVSAAQVNLSGGFLFWNSIPTNLANIKFTIKQVSATASPTPAASPGAQFTPTTSH